MPFEGLARSISQEHERQERERNRSSSVGSRRSVGAPIQNKVSTMTRPDRVPEEREHGIEGDNASSRSSDTAADVEAQARSPNGEKGAEGEKREPQQENSQEEEDPFFVTIKGRDHLNPHTWNVAYRWFLTMFAGLLVLNATFASSAPSNLLPAIIQHYGVSQEVGILTISLFVAGYCVGPLLWGPLSERYGRKPVFVVSFLPYIGWQVGSALSPNIGSMLIFRFLGGCFASSPLTVSGGVIADLWDADRRGKALSAFSLAPFAGPAIAPIVSGFLYVSGVNFRWIFWILTIFAGVCFVLIVALLPETYVPVLLHKEVKRLRKETGDNRWHSMHEDRASRETVRDVMNRTIFKPFRMIVEEPMLLAITIYMSLVYGVVYLLFEAVPIIFEGNHGLQSGYVGLTFLALPVGGTLSVLVYLFYYNPKYVKLHHELAAQGRPVPPEERLPILFPAAIMFAVSFFWVGWTAYPSISIASPILAIVMLGAAILLIFLGCFNYLIDAYLVNAASALSINTVCRSSFGAGFPLFTSQMYARLGIPGASSLLGGLAILFIPMPFVLYKYGRKIRSMSKHAVVRENE